MTYPFMQLPTILPGPDFNPNKPEDQKTADKEVMTRLQPVNIEAYHEGYYWGTLIIMKSGERFMSKLSVKEFEQHLFGYWKAINDRMKQPQSNLVTL